MQLWYIRGNPDTGLPHGTLIMPTASYTKCSDVDQTRWVLWWAQILQPVLDQLAWSSLIIWDNQRVVTSVSGTCSNTCSFPSHLPLHSHGCSESHPWGLRWKSYILAPGNLREQLECNAVGRGNGQKSCTSLDRSQITIIKMINVIKTPFCTRSLTALNNVFVLCIPIIMIRKKNHMNRHPFLVHP